MISPPQKRSPDAQTSGLQTSGPAKASSLEQDSATSLADQFGRIEAYALHDPSSSDLRGLCDDLAAIVTRGWPVIFTPEPYRRGGWAAAVQVNGRTVLEFERCRTWSEALTWCEWLGRAIPNSRVMP